MLARSAARILIKRARQTNPQKPKHAAVLLEICLRFFLLFASLIHISSFCGDFRVLLEANRPKGFSSNLSLISRPLKKLLTKLPLKPRNLLPTKVHHFSIDSASAFRSSTRCLYYKAKSLLLASFIHKTDRDLENLFSPFLSHLIAKPPWKKISF